MCSLLGDLPFIYYENLIGVACVLQPVGNHNEIPQHHSPDSPVLLYLCQHKQAHRPAQQGAAYWHVEGQNRIGCKKDGPHQGEHQKKAEKMLMVNRSLTVRPF